MLTLSTTSLVYTLIYPSTSLVANELTWYDFRTGDWMWPSP